MEIKNFLGSTFAKISRIFSSVRSSFASMDGRRKQSEFFKEKLGHFVSKQEVCESKCRLLRRVAPRNDGLRIRNDGGRYGATPRREGSGKAVGFGVRGRLPPSLILLSLFFIFQFSFFNFPLSAEDSFPQKIEWKSNANALEYKVEVQNTQTGKTQVITTDKNATELSLAPGRYRYRVIAYDFLGKESSVSSWTNFEVFKANKPKIKDIEKNVTLGKDSNSVEISVDISDVNRNSKFELVSEGLEGAITATERAKMGSGSETDSVTKLDFKNVPPGKWRLKVTNASGLESYSDVIDVQGEKLYTADEVAKIRDETKAQVKKEFDDNLDEYIKKAEAEKAEKARLEALEKERQEKARLAEEARLKAERERAEKARLEAERIAEEKRREEARIAEEKRQAEERARLEAERKAAEERLIAERKAEEERRAAEKAAKEAEEKRLAEEKARAEAERLAKIEEEKRAKAEWKRLHPYQWKDVSLMAGAGYTFTLYDDMIKSRYDESNALALNARFKMLPIKTENNKFGLELGFLTQKFSGKLENYYEAELKSTVFDVKFVWQHKIFSKLYWSAKAGGGFSRLTKSMDYSDMLSKRDNPDDGSYVYPSVVAGASLFLYPWKCFVLEAGVDFNQVFAGGSNLGFVAPYACVGVRF